MLRPSDRAPGLLLGEGVELPETVEIGGNVVIHRGTVVGPWSRLLDGAVLGKPLALGPRSSAPREEPPPLVVGEGATVGAAAVVLAGARVGDRVVVADQAHVRERAVIGPESVIGRGAAVENDVEIGARVRVQTGAYLTAHTVVEDDVFLAPGCVTTNDDTMGRRAPGAPLRGARLRRACRVGAGAVLLPGVEVGEEAFVAAAALVSRDVPPRTVVMGVPARPVGEVAELDLLEARS